MNCDEFREKISKSDNNAELREHFENCKACKKWLDDELKIIPEGATSEKWNNLIDSIKEEKPVEDIVSDNKKEEEKSFLDYYLSGLKYGIVFGIAIVIGFGIVDINKSSNTKNNVINENSVASDTVIIPKNSIATNTKTIK